MLRNLLAALLFVGFAASASAQGLYVRASGSYQIGAAKGAVLSTTNPFSATAQLSEDWYWGIEGASPLQEGDYNSGELSPVNDSYGAGVYAGIGIGYMLNEYIGFELGVGYLFGSERDSRVDFAPDYEDNRYSFNMLGVTPSLVLKAPLSDNLALTARNGVFVGLSPQLTVTNEYSGFSFNDFSHETEIEGSMELGFQSSLGLSYNLSSALALSFDITYTGVRFTPETGTVTAFTVDGVDQLNNFLSPNERSFSYVETYDGTSGELPSFQVSASSLGFGLSLQYTFGQ